MPVKLVLRSGSQSVALELKDGEYRLGREKPADVIIPDTTVSSNHAELQVKGDVWMVRDLGSTNGTFLGNAQVGASAVRVKPGAALRLGSAELTLVSPAVVAAASTAAVPSAGQAAAAKVTAAKEAAGRLQWTARYWIAGAEAVLLLLILFFFVQLYSASSSSKQWLVSRYRTFAAQYVHVLNDPARTEAPAPVLDESLADAVVANRDGAVLYPSGEMRPPTSPLIDPKTKDVYQNAKYGLFTLPGSANEEGKSLQSYPVRSGGDLLGFVIARPGLATDTNVGFILLLLTLAAVIALALLFFALKPVHALIRVPLESLRLKISPFANGMVEELPRSERFGELNAVAAEIEQAVRTAAAAGSGRLATRGGRVAEDAPELIAQMVEASRIPYCVVDVDFRIVLRSADFDEMAEFRGAREGVSLFEAGLTSIQAKQLVQAIGDARRDGTAETRMQLERDGVADVYAVTVRSLAGGGASLIGLMFSKAGSA